MELVPLLPVFSTQQLAVIPKTSVGSPVFVQAANLASPITEASPGVGLLPPDGHTGHSPFLPASRSYCYGKVVLGVLKKH